MPKIDAYEQAVLSAFEKGRLESVATKAELAAIKAAARAAAIKDRRVNIRQGRQVVQSADTPMRVAFVTPEQHESLVDLLGELHAYYHDAPVVPRDAVRVHLLDNLLAVDSPLRLVVASHAGSRVAGFAAIALLYSLVDPTPQGRRQCLLKELFVRASERNQGVGRALMAWVARYAVTSGCCRIDWPVNAANRQGISFYEGLGAEAVADRLSYRLAGPNLARIARESAG